jgi:hypothetical protein
MGIFDKLRKPEPAPATPLPSPGQQAVLICLKGEDFDRMIALSDALERVIEMNNLGMFDGNEIGGGETTLFMYGPDSETLFTHIEPVLHADYYAKDAVAVIRQGPPGSTQRTVNL